MKNVSNLATILGSAASMLNLKKLNDMSVASQSQEKEGRSAIESLMDKLDLIHLQVSDLQPGSDEKDDSLNTELLSSISELKELVLKIPTTSGAGESQAQNIDQYQYKTGDLEDIINNGMEHVDEEGNRNKVSKEDFSIMLSLLTIDLVEESMHREREFNKYLYQLLIEKDEGKKEEFHDWIFNSYRGEITPDYNATNVISMLNGKFAGYSDNQPAT